MFDLNREVYVPGLGEVGRVTERNYEGTPRHAVYIVTLEAGGDVMVGTGKLRAHDYYCDGCSGSRNGAPAASHEEYGDFCFLCVREAEAERWRSQP